MRRSLRIWKNSNVPATITDSMSAIGIDIQAPIAPYLGVRVSNNGSRNSSWRVVDRNIASGARPIYWKKLPDTIWKPTSGNTIIATPKPCATTSTIAWSATPLLVSTKAAATSWGKNTPIRKAKVVTHDAAIIVYLSTVLTRLYCFAP